MYDTHSVLRSRHINQKDFMCERRFFYYCISAFTFSVLGYYFRNISCLCWTKSLLPYKSQCILRLINDLKLWINPRCLVGAMDGSVMTFWKNECQELTFGGFLWSKICCVFSYLHALCASISVWTTWSEGSRGRSIKPREVVLLTCVHADRFWSACCHFSTYSFSFSLSSSYATSSVCQQHI